MEKNSAWNEVFGLILLFVGTLLFLALISYTPKDVPSWVWFSSSSPANHPAQNFIGPFGAIVAGIRFQVIGAAPLFFGALFFVFRAGAMFCPPFSGAPRIAWILPLYSLG